MSKNRAGGFYWERNVYQSKAFLSLGINAMKMLIALFDVRVFEKPSKAKDNYNEIFKFTLMTVSAVKRSV